MMPSESRIRPEYLTPQEVAAKFRMSLKWVVKYTQLHRIPGQIKVGGRWRYRLEDVEDAIVGGFLLLPPKPKKAAPSYFSARAGRPLWRHNGV